MNLCVKKGVHTLLSDTQKGVSMSFQLKPQKYDLRHLLGMPLACEPLCTVGVVAQKVLTGVVNVLWVLVEAEFIDRAVRLVTGGETLAGMLPFVAAMVLIVAWKRMGYSFGRILTRRIEVSAVYQMGVEAVKKRSRLKFKLIEDEKTWELSNRISRDMKNNVWSMTQHTCNFIVGLVRIIGVFLIIFAQSMGLGIGCLFLSLPVLIFSVISGKKTYKAYKEAAVFARRGDYLQGVMTDRESIHERALFSYVDYVNEKWLEQTTASRKIFVGTAARRELRNGISAVLTNTISTIMVCFLIAELGRGTLTVGVFIALSKAIYEMIDLMQGNIGGSLVTMAHYAAYMKDLTQFANLEEQEGTDSLPEKPQALESLEFCHVTFRYPGTEKDILRDFSLKLEAGKHYAFVGENGAGKTTVTKLLTGLYDEYQGEILINGRELREYTQAQLKGMFTGVYQDFARYYDTVADNILLGDLPNMEKPDAVKRMEGHLQDLGIREEMESLPKGYDTPLGKLEEGSVDLSGGQWQRVAMARCLMSPAPIQILDEPTAALDPISESRLYEEFKQISRGRTTVFISHRLGSTGLADEIFVLQDGRVAESGSHRELMAMQGLYAQMYESQKSWYQCEGSH